MAVENDPVDGLTENDDVRRKALLRLGVAGVVTAAALAGLWWLDQGSGKPGKAVTATPPSPIVSAPLQASAPPQAAPEETAATPEAPGATPEAASDEPASVAETTDTRNAGQTPTRATAAAGPSAAPHPARQDRKTVV